MPILKESQQGFVNILPITGFLAGRAETWPHCWEKTALLPSKFWVKGEKYSRFCHSKPSSDRLLAKMCWFITLAETVLRAVLNIAELCTTPECWTFSLFLAACRRRNAGMRLALASVWQRMLSIFAALWKQRWGWTACVNPLVKIPPKCGRKGWVDVFGNYQKLGFLCNALR